jgi:hypothetical protein
VVNALVKAGVNMGENGSVCSYTESITTTTKP